MSRLEELGIDMPEIAEPDDKYSADRNEPNPDAESGEDYDDKRPLDELSRLRSLAIPQ
jgi:hypothetical protein